MQVTHPFNLTVHSSREPYCLIWCPPIGPPFRRDDIPCGESFLELRLHQLSPKSLGRTSGREQARLTWAPDRLSNDQPASNETMWKKKGHRRCSPTDPPQKKHKNGNGTGFSSGAVTPQNNGKKKGRLGSHRRKEAVNGDHRSVRRGYRTGRPEGFPVPSKGRLQKS